METIDIGRELQDIMASEELLAFFDFTLTLEGGDTEGLCKVSRPRSRRSKSTYLSVFLTIDLPDDATYRAVEARLKSVDWGAAAEGLSGIDCFVAIPHRSHKGGLFLKEVDVYLDGSRPPDVAFVRDVLQPAVARALDLRPGELTVWEESGGAPTSPPQQAQRTSLLDRIRRLGGRE